MAVSYIEEYKINGWLFGIEDYKIPGNHFMPDKAHKRFKCWFNHCGIDETDNLVEARELINLYVHKKLAEVEAQAKQKLAACAKAKEKLLDNGIAVFIVVPQASVVY